MTESRAPHWMVREHPGTVLTALGVLVYGACGLAYYHFYSHLHVAPAEIGLGYVEILGQAAIGIVALVLIFGGFVVVLGGLHLAVMGLRLPGNRVGRLFTLALVGGLLASIASELDGLITRTLVVVVIGLAALRTMRLGRAAGVRPAPWEVAFAAASVQFVAVVLLTLLLIPVPGTGADPGAARVAVAVVLAIPLLGAFLASFSYAGWLGARLPAGRAAPDPAAGRAGPPDKPDNPDPAADPPDPAARLAAFWRGWPGRPLPGRRLPAAGAILFAAGLLTLVGGSAYTETRAVAHGVPPSGLFVISAHSNVSCARVTWLGERPPPVLPASVIYLGHANDRVVLYLPGQGPVRLPAGDVAVAAAPVESCRLSP
jgi:hypothetical protein